MSNLVYATRLWNNHQLCSKPNNSKVKKTKEQNWLKSHMSEGGEPRLKSHIPEGGEPRLRSPRPEGGEP